MNKTSGILLALVVAAGTTAYAGDKSFAGRFVRDDNRRAFTVVLTEARLITIRTVSYGGGVSASGETIPPGGFDPSLFLFNAEGLLIAQNRDGGCTAVTADPTTGRCWDAHLEVRLPAGTYHLVLTQDDNTPLGPFLPDGFSRDQAGNFTAEMAGLSPAPFWDVTPAERNGSYSVDILGADSANPE